MNRLSAYFRRLRKERPGVWVSRHERARQKVWDILWGNPPSEARLAQAERSMRRLLALGCPWERADHRVLLGIYPYFYHVKGSRNYNWSGLS